MSCPSAIGVRSTSIGAPAAIVEASGFICETNGQSEATPPTAAKAPVATKRKSRRVGCSAEDAVVTIPNPFIACCRRNRPGKLNREAAGARDPRGGRKTAFFRPHRLKEQSRIVLLAPLPEERKPAIGWQTCNALIPRSAPIFLHIFGCGPKYHSREMAVITGCQNANIGIECRSRFTSPTSPRTPAPSSGFVPAWG